MVSKYWTIIFLIFLGCSKNSSNEDIFSLNAVFLGSQEIPIQSSEPHEITLNPKFELIFSHPVQEATLNKGINLKQELIKVELSINQNSSNKNNVVVSPKTALEYNSIYSLQISATLQNIQGSTVVPIEILFRTSKGTIQLTEVVIGNQIVDGFKKILDIDPIPSISVSFDNLVRKEKLQSIIRLKSSPIVLELTGEEIDNSFKITPISSLDEWTEYTLIIDQGAIGVNEESFQGFEKEFYTTIDSLKHFPAISSEELLVEIQRQTFKYFWDFGHDPSGMARERNRNGNTVTTGGSGFGLMSILVGIQNEFINREEGLERIQTIVSFLEGADRFHGAWPHWINGMTGNTIPFSANDDGGDLVETAFMVQGLLTVRQFLNRDNELELTLYERINQLWKQVEWTWYTKGGEKALYWHWSPNFEWKKNLKITGHNETLITYILAASSPTFPVEKEAYHEGYARSGNIKNGNDFFDLTLPLGRDYGGPLFFSHYSFLGLDPRKLSDEYANYWEQNVTHSLINQRWCIENPSGYVGYSADCWGLTASDSHDGYAAHSPSIDLGVITPTAALSSIPYTPDESIKAAEFFYYYLGDKLWGEYGFYDAFNPTEDWYASSYLAIDQGPIICMIENYKNGMLWDLFMSAPEIQSGLTKLGFTY